MKTNLDKFIYQLRIPATVEVVEIPETDVSAYAVERTMALEQRKQLLTRLQLNKDEQKQDVESLLDKSRLEVNAQNNTVISNKNYRFI
jgi:potassium/chloride transporter 4/5/6